MDLYIVCMDSYRVRDAQMFDTVGISDQELLEIDSFDESMAERWHDMEPTPFIGVVEAENESDARQKAGTEYRYDPRCLFAIKYKTGVINYDNQ